MPQSLDQYEQAIHPSRARFANSTWVTHYVHAAPDPDTLERFLLHFCALGFQMTAPVESWIRAAGQRCLELGIEELGSALLKHARSEAGHELLMANDARALHARRVKAGRSNLDVEALLQSPRKPGIERYVRLHEETISGPSPYGQIAIEYEIERLSVAFGADFITRCVSVLGPEVRACLSFLEDHVALDAGHTQFNARQLQRVLDANPEFLPELVRAGSAALEAYALFLDDCSRLAEA